jgi:hypothetical protein
MTAKTNAVQTISFGGSVTGGTFTLGYATSFTSATTGPITYSSNLVTLQSNFQTALNGLSNLLSGSALVSVMSPSSATVVFQGSSVSGQKIATMTVHSSLTGTNPTVGVATTTVGFNAWFLNATILVTGLPLTARATPMLPGSSLQPTQILIPATARLHCHPQVFLTFSSANWTVAVASGG